MLATGGISAWQPSVVKDPWLFGGSLTGISGMISDDKKRLSMKKAIQVYTDKANLKELLRVIGWYYTSVKMDKSKNVLTNYKTEVNKLLKQVIPNHNEVVKIAATIERATTVPHWFSRTKLCYSWYPDGDGGQCGGGAGRLLCATVNGMTNYYRDDTDRRGGG